MNQNLMIVLNLKDVQFHNHIYGELEIQYYSSSLNNKVYLYYRDGDRVLKNFCFKSTELIQQEDILTHQLLKKHKSFHTYACSVSHHLCARFHHLKDMCKAKLSSASCWPVGCSWATIQGCHIKWIKLMRRALLMVWILSNTERINAFGTSSSLNGYATSLFIPRLLIQLLHVLSVFSFNLGLSSQLKPKCSLQIDISFNWCSISLILFCVGNCYLKQQVASSEVIIILTVLY